MPPSFGKGIKFTNKVAVDALESLLEIIKQTLAAENDVLVSGFGKIKEQDERKYKN
jgi:nucleoid DNA-binding protein